MFLFISWRNVFCLPEVRMWAFDSMVGKQRHHVSGVGGEEQWCGCTAQACRQRQRAAGNPHAPTSSKRLQRIQRRMQEFLFFLLLYRREADEKYDFFCTNRERSSLRSSATSWRKQWFLRICRMGLLTFLVQNSMHPGEELGCIVQCGPLWQRHSL